MAPTEMKALKSVSPGKAEIQTVPLPKLRDDYVLLKVHSVAINPTDWKHIDYLASKGCTVGCDFAGTVVEVGKSVTRKFSAGQRIAGVTHGVNKVEPEDGCFAEFSVAKGDISIVIPDNISFEEASTLGVGINTVGQGLYRSLQLPFPGEGSADGQWLLIYGGSTATGTLAIQYAKASGSKVISINSPSNDELVKSLGADAVFDYHDEKCGEKIREFTKDGLVKVFDCISTGDSGKISGKALSSKGGKISGLLPGIDAGRTDVEVTSTLAYSVTGEAFSFAGTDIPAQPEEFEFAKKNWAYAEKALAEGKLKVHPVDVRKGGLDEVVKGLDEMRQGKVSGKKVVITLA